MGYEINQKVPKADKIYSLFPISLEKNKNKLIQDYKKKKTWKSFDLEKKCFKRKGFFSKSVLEYNCLFIFWFFFLMNINRQLDQDIIEINFS